MTPTLADVIARRIVPVVVVKDANTAAPLAEALIAGNLPVAEVTFRTEAAPDAIRAMAKYPDLLVGAGTILTVAQLEQAVDAGARFIVSPGLSVAVVLRAQELGIPIVPGAVTPTEIMTARDLGLRTLKFFPASSFGGVATIKDLASPFGGISFIPTGGVSAGNLADYLGLPNVVAVGGSWMVKADLINDGDYAAITTLSAQAVQAAAAIEK